jgi:protein-disulfide isomerase
MSRKKRKQPNPVTARSGLSTNVVMAIAVFVVAVVVIGGVVVTQRGNSAHEATRAPQSPLNGHALTTSDSGAVNLVEFVDFQCPACARFYSGVVRKIEEDYRGRITFTARNLPLEMHPLAELAARAAEAAAAQGRYAEMYHALYDNFDQWAVDGPRVSADRDRADRLFGQYAEAAGLDRERFRADLASPEVRASIERDVADADSLGVTGTPTFFLNGQKFQSRGTSFADVDRELRDRIDAMIER